MGDRAPGRSGWSSGSFRSCPCRASSADGDRFRLEEHAPGSIGRMHGFHGNVGILVRAYVYVFLHGRDGLREVSDRAVLNANYLAALLRDTFPLAYPDVPPMHEFVGDRRGRSNRKPASGPWTWPNA